MLKTCAQARHFSFIAPWVMSERYDEWAPVFCLGKQCSWPKKQALYTQGDRCDEIILLTRGFVKIVAVDPRGNHRSIGVLGPGSILGEVSFFYDTPYRHNMVAVLETAGYIFDKRTVLEDILQNYPDIARYLLRNIATKSYMMSTQLECATFMSREQMIANYLFHLSREQEKNSWVYLKLSNFSLTTIAELMGVHRVTVTNIINKFKQQGIVEMENGRMRIVLPEALEAILAA